jgi:hypothetical protein
MSGGPPRIGDLSGNSRGNREPPKWDPFPDEAAKAERLAKERASRVNQEVLNAAPLPPDIGDIALRDANSGRVRRVRGGSTRESIIGQAMALGPIVLMAIGIWLRHLVRGE